MEVYLEEDKVILDFDGQMYYLDKKEASWLGKTLLHFATGTFDDYPRKRPEKLTDAFYTNQATHVAPYAE